MEKENKERCENIDTLYINKNIIINIVITTKVLSNYTSSCIRFLKYIYLISFFTLSFLIVSLIFHSCFLGRSLCLFP